MTYKHKLKLKAQDAADRLLMLNSRRSEVKKFKDKRRKAIYSQIELTPEQKAAVDALYLENYGEKIPYTWHRHYTAFTGHFDAGYMPELLGIPEFEHFMNLNLGMAKALEDKNFLPLIAKAAGVKMPQTCLSCTWGVYRDRDGAFLARQEAGALLADIGKVFAKPSVDAGSGRGCILLDMQNGSDRLSGKNAQQLLDELGDNFVVQERLKCHKSIAELYPNSVNTFRVISYRWKDKIELCPAVMRIGQGGNHLDNAHAGGMFVAVKSGGG